MKNCIVRMLLTCPIITHKRLTTLLPSSSPSLFHNLTTGQILIIIPQSTKFCAQGIIATYSTPGKFLNYPGVAESREMLWKIAEYGVPLFSTVVGLFWDILISCLTHCPLRFRNLRIIKKTFSPLWTDILMVGFQWSLFWGKDVYQTTFGAPELA